MPISAHLLRKLQDTIGMDATADLATIVDSVEATRADLAELRHEFNLLKTRVESTATRSDLAELRTEVAGLATRDQLKDALLTQTRWVLGGIVLVLTAIVFKG